MDHPYDLHKSDPRRVAETFDGIVRLLLAHEMRGALRVNGHHVLEAAERVRRLSPQFLLVDLDACVRRLEYSYAARRAVHEVD